MTQPERPNHSAIEPPPLDEADETLLVELIDALCASARRGEQPDVDEAARDHPRLASELRSLWATIWVAETLALPHLAPVPRSATVDHSDANPEPAADRAGTERFGDYLLLDELGRGGMGVVFRAREPGRDRIVALEAAAARAGRVVARGRPVPRRGDRRITPRPSQCRAGLSGG